MRTLTITLNIDIDEERLLDAEGYNETEINASWICDSHGGYFQYKSDIDYESRDGFLDTMTTAARDVIFRVMEENTLSEKDLEKERLESVIHRMNERDLNH